MIFATSSRHRNVRITATVLLLVQSCHVQGWSLVDRLQGSLCFRHPTRRDASPSSDHYEAGVRRREPSNSSSSSNKRNQKEMMSFINRPMESTVGDITQSSRLDTDLMELVECIIRAADARKADNIVALDVAQVTTLSNVLIILSGNSRPQNQAIASAITKDVEEVYGWRPGGNGVPEGSAESGWMLLDYGSVMVHIMTPKSRLYYNVEGQWRAKGGREIDVSSVIVPNSVGRPSSDYVQQAKDDPFWS